MRRILVLAAVLAMTACDRPRAPAEPPIPPPPPAPPAPPAPVAPAVPPAPPRPAEAFDALGTEPFWAFSIRQEVITFSGLDRTTHSWPNPGVRWQGRRRMWAARSAAGEIAVSIDPAQCSDGMSDRTYPYAVEVRLGGEVLKRCASKAAA